jgi:hypothetical protein
MTLGDANAQSDSYSGRASENVRALAFAGLAFVWIVAGTLAEIRGILLAAAVLLLVALFVDFLHYVIGWGTWEFFVRRVERDTRARGEEVSPETPAEYDESMLRWIYGAYYVKVGAVLAAYLVLGIAVLSRIGSVPPSPPAS